MIEHGLTDPGDQKSKERELEDMKTKTEGTDALRFILSLPDPPETVDAEDPAEANAERVMAAALAYMRKVSEVQVYLTTFPELDQPSTRAAAAALDTAGFDSKAAGRLLRA